jgi:hypothetical protein
MLSDERIAELADKYYSPVGNTKYIEQAIKDALAEAAQVPVKRVAVTSDVVARLGGQRLCCDCGTVLAMDDGTMCGECFSNRFGESYSSKPSVAQVPVMGEPVALREFADEVKQLCKDFSDRHNRPYMGDVTAAIDGLLAQFVAGQTSHATQAELDLLRKDAARYQWLRMQGAQSDKVDKVHYFGPKLDEAIDAAIAKAKGETK